MSVTREIRICIHQLTDGFQVVFSSIEMGRYKQAERQARRMMELLRRVHLLCQTLEDDERDTLQ